MPPQSSMPLSVPPSALRPLVSVYDVPNSKHHPLILPTSWGPEENEGEGEGGSAHCAPQGKGNQLLGNSHRMNLPQFWVKEVGQTGTMARHNTQNGQKCCDHRSPFKNTVHNGCNFP